MAYHEWEAVIGLEIHAQLNTRSKLFSSDYNRFGDDPNQNISELSVALPGSLPVVNKAAVEKAIRFGLSIGGAVQPWSQFARKSYFYPDCPRNYQITQPLEFPLIRGGTVCAVVDGIERSFAVNRVQLEDDAGMLKHFTTFAGVDFNRSGVPLIEIISEPCMHSPQEASAYAMAIRSILDYLDVSDCNMEEGSFRFDVNTSVRKKGEKTLRNRIEIKNMNSFSSLELAIAHEIEKQIALYEANPHEDPDCVVQQCTYRWDPDTSKTVLMRTKENAEDYRYFPEPDLLPLVIEQEVIEAIRTTIPELPLVKKQRFIQEFGLTEQQSTFFTTSRFGANYFEAVVRLGCSPKMAATWVGVEFAGRLEMPVWESGIDPAHIAELISLIQNKIISGKIAKEVADAMVASPGLSPREIVEKTPGFTLVQDADTLRVLVEEVVNDNMPTVRDVLGGRDRSFAFLVGQVMKKTQGRASPDIVNSLLREIIETKR